MNFFKKIFSMDPEADYQFALREDMNSNYSKAYWLFEKAAQKNLAKAQFQCGLMCLKGRGTTKNFAKAYEFINKAAHQDYYKAQYLLSQMYLFGIGVNKDKVESNKLLEKAKQHGEDLAKLSFLELWDGYGED